MPDAPPPEYEPPVVMPWDAGAAVDPLDQVEGEWVTDEPTTASEAGTPAPPSEDAAAPPFVDGSAASADGGLDSGAPSADGG